MGTGSLVTDQEIVKDALEHLTIVESGATVKSPDEAIGLIALDNIIKSLAIEGVNWTSGLLNKAKNEWKLGLGYGVADALSLKYPVPADIRADIKTEWAIKKHEIVSDYVSDKTIEFTVAD